MRDLLRFAAVDLPSRVDCDGGTPVKEVSDTEIQWLLDAGMGPLLHRAVECRALWIPDGWRDVVLSADLTAQVRHGNVVETACEVIDVCGSLGVNVTLLKGISVSEQYYPAEHLRPMGDIDVLVPENCLQAVETALAKRGYTALPGYKRHSAPRHGVPLRHPAFRVWVEVHVSMRDNVGRDDVFGPAHVAAQSVRSEFHGRPVNRLTDEMQLLFIAHSWIEDLSSYVIKIHPSCLPALLDVVFLVKSRRLPLERDRLVGWPGSKMMVACLYVMLDYLHRRGVAPQAAGILPSLATSQNIVGGLQIRMIHAMLDHYLLGARRWNLILPLPVPGRYNFRHQISKRLFDRR